MCCEGEEWRAAAGVVGAETQPFYHVRPTCGFVAAAGV